MISKARHALTTRDLGTCFAATREVSLSFDEFNAYIDEWKQDLSRNLR